MATRSPRRTPRERSTLAHLFTCTYRSQYVSVRLSPGSPSNTSAALLRRAVPMWRSTQFTDALSFPPMNHCAWGGCQSSTCFQGVIHSSFAASPAQ